jgi:hypothetical protein
MCFVPRINQKNRKLVFIIRPQYQYQHKFANNVEFQKCIAYQAQNQIGQGQHRKGGEENMREVDQASDYTHSY